MSNISSNNKRIAQNTILLYMRMILLMVVGLYTSRVVLQALGVSDFGLYSLVGGFVAMLAYMNSVFVAATQRFLAFSLGKGNIDASHRLFCTSVTVHYALAIIILIIAETFGLWFVNTQLVIDPDRLVAANWAYQCSLISLCVTIISIPYNASIVAHEHMSVYAYMSILDAVLKLAIVYLVMISPVDKLIVYACLMAAVAVVIRFTYTIYCKRKFRECYYEFIIDKPQLREMATYAGWTAVGTLGFTFKDQVINIILNIFGGTVVNAARGVAMQAASALRLFASNFLMAVSPQITKQYASGNYEHSRALVYNSAKFAFYLMTLICIPIILNLDSLLMLWLGNVPEYTYEFLIVLLLTILIDILSSPVGTAIQATGNIRNFQIGISLIFLIEIPATYFLLKVGYGMVIALLPSIITQFMGCIFRFLVLKNLVEGYSLRSYLLYVVLKPLLIVIATFFICYFISKQMPDNFVWLVISFVVYIIIVVFFIYSIGLNKEERIMLHTIIKNKINKTKNDNSFPFNRT